MEAIDPSISARGRLTVLSAHLTAISAVESPPLLDASGASAQSNVPPSGNLKGSLTVTDRRTGKNYEIQVSEEGAVKATDFKKVWSSILRFVVFDWLYMWISWFTRDEMVNFMSFACLDADSISPLAGSGFYCLLAEIYFSFLMWMLYFPQKTKALLVRLVNHPK